MKQAIRGETIRLRPTKPDMRTLGSYRLEAPLGGGAMGAVYVAIDSALDRRVALKLLPIELGAQSGFRQRFEKEARLIARLEHRHIVPVYAYGVAEEDTPWMAMRLMPGGNLSALLATGRLPFSRALSILDAVASALDYAHLNGVVHRDVKPANVLLDRDGAAYLADFGVASVLEGSVILTNTRAGTPVYMAPEQWKGERVDNRCDIYALGIMAYEMLLGRRPFSATTSEGLMRQHLMDDVPMPPPGELPARVCEALGKALAKSPDDRWACAGTFVAMLKAEPEREPVRETGQESGPPENRKPLLETAKSPALTHDPQPPDTSIVPVSLTVRNAGRLRAWRATVGARVVSGQPLFDVGPPSARAVAMVAISPIDGMLTDVIAPAGASVIPGQVIARLRPVLRPGGNGPEVTDVMVAETVRAHDLEVSPSPIETSTAKASTWLARTFRGSSGYRTGRSTVRDRPLFAAIGLALLAVCGSYLYRLSEIVRVQGRVMNTRGEPIPNAQVSLVGATLHLTATTRPDGEFSIDAVRRGRYNLSAGAVGYAPRDQSLALQKVWNSQYVSLILAEAAPIMAPPTLSPAPPRPLATPSAREPPYRATSPTVAQATPPLRSPAAVTSSTPAPALPADVPPQSGVLQLVVRPWAEVTVNGRNVGTTPLKPLVLKPGIYALLFTNPKYGPEHRTVTISPGETVRVEIELRR